MSQTAIRASTPPRSIDRRLRCRAHWAVPMRVHCHETECHLLACPVADCLELFDWTAGDGDWMTAPDIDIRVHLRRDRQWAR